MALNLSNYEKKAKESVKAFWGNRDAAKKKQIEIGNIDQGNRAAVTAGKNMDGFLALFENLVASNGLQNSQFHVKRSVLTLPGFFRATKSWDILVMVEKRIIAVVEFKSQIGSLGNNFNNRSEEAIGSATDFRTAFREGFFGDQTPLFFGFLALVEDSDDSRKPVRTMSPHFNIDKCFTQASYLDRYDILCKRLVREGLYDAAALIATSPSSVKTGKYRSISEVTGLKSLVTAFAGHIAIEAARSPGH